MNTATNHMLPLTQAYDHSKVREYYKKHDGFIFSWEETVRAELLENKLVLKMATDKMPDEVWLNGQEYTLTLKHHD